MVSEFKIREAFHAVKNDVAVLQAEVARLSKENSMLVSIVKKQTDALTKKATAKKSTPKKVTKKATKKTAKKAAKKSSQKSSSDKVAYIASKNGSKYHATTSPFVNRIKKEDRVYFKSEGEALKKGYSPSQFTK